MAMKKITLYRASSSNGGSFLDSGTTVDIGDDADQISADRAQDLVDTGGGASATAAAAAENQAPVEPVTDPAPVENGATGSTGK